MDDEIKSFLWMMAGVAALVVVVTLSIWFVVKF